MPATVTQYAKQILQGTTLVVGDVRSYDSSYPLTLKSADGNKSTVFHDTNGVVSTSNGIISLNAADVRLPQLLSTNPVKTNGSGVFIA